MTDIQDRLMAYLDITPREYEDIKLPLIIRNLLDCVATSLQITQRADTTFPLFNTASSSSPSPSPTRSTHTPADFTIYLTLEPMCKAVAQYINACLRTRHPSIQIQRELETFVAGEFEILAKS